VCWLAPSIFFVFFPAWLHQWWHGGLENAGGRLRQQQWRRWQSWPCRLALSSAAPPPTVCPDGIQLGDGCTMPCNVCTNGRCTFSPPYSSCCHPWAAPSSMPYRSSAWFCLKCSSCSSLFYCTHSFSLALPLRMSSIYLLV
jgi:hypothetical protein